MDVYQFADLPSDGSKTPEIGSLHLESPTVAVLPMHSEMVVDSVRATAGVIRADLIHRLSRVPGLDVVDAKAEPGSGGPGGTARYVIESGMHQAGDRVRIYATLFDVTTMNVVKSYKRTAGIEELFDLSDELADEVAHAIEVELIGREPAGLYAELDDPEAIEKIYLGWYHLTSGTPEGWARAVRLFGEVAESHPHMPYGHSLSAFANWSGASNRWVPDPETALQLAMDQAQRSIGLGDPTGFARMVVAAILMSQGRGEEALEAMEEVEIVRPTCDVTYGLEGSVRRYMGQWEKAVDLLDVAIRLTGVNKPWYPTVKACSLYFGGRVEQAASMAERVLEYQPTNLEALLVLAAEQVEMGLLRRAKATAKLIKERFPAVDVEAWIATNPYQVPEMLEKWRSDLAEAGVI